MSSTATQHGGQEMTQFSGIANLLHFGMSGARYQGKRVAQIAAQLVRG